MTERRGHYRAQCPLLHSESAVRLRVQRRLRAECFLEFTEDHAVVRTGIRGARVAREVHRAGKVAIIRKAETISTAKTASGVWIVIAIAVARRTAASVFKRKTTEIRKVDFLRV